MYKLIRFFNQNRKKILRIALVIVFLIFLIQLMNWIMKNRKEDDKYVDNSVDNSEQAVISNTEYVSDKSGVTGEKVSGSKLKGDKAVIDSFIQFCNGKEYENAYNLLTDECKEVMFVTLKDFYKVYYKSTFGGESKTYVIENWTDNTYKVEFTGDIMATGKVGEGSVITDYITVVDGEKLNVNSFIGREKVDKSSSGDGIEFNVNYRDVYMDYAVCNITVTNNSNNTVLLDPGNDAKSVYLESSKKGKFYFYGNEVIANSLLLKPQYKNTVNLKFICSYSSSIKINGVVFSKVILDYDDYKTYSNKDIFEEYKEIKASM